MILYLSANNHKPFIWPDFRGRELDEAVSFLEQHEYSPKIIHNTQKNDGTFIIDQRPIAGSLIDLQNDTKPLVQLYIQ